MGAVGAHWASLRGVFAQPSWVSILLQAFTIIGGGRVGQALVDMGDGKDVSATSNICSVLLTVPCPCSGAQQHGTGPPSLSLTPPPPCIVQVLVKRGGKIEGPPGPIIVATRNDSLAGIVEATPADRRQGGLLVPALGATPCATARQASAGSPLPEVE